MPSLKSFPADLSNRMNNRLKTLPRATVVMRKQEARLPGGLLDLALAA